MPRFIRLKNGLEVPQNTLMSNASDIYTKFNSPLSSPRSMPEMLFRLVLTLQSNFSRQYLTNYEIDILELPLHNFFVGHLEQKNRTHAMARTALAVNMIAVEEYDGEIEGYLDEPVGPQLPVLSKIYKDNSTNQAAPISK